MENTDVNNIHTTTLDLIPQPIVIHNADKILFCNQEDLATFKINKLNSIINKSIMDFIHPDSLDIARERIEKLKEGIRLDWTEQVFRSINGKIINAEVKTIPITYKGQKAFLSILKDIGKRKVFEEKILSQKDRFKTLFDLNPDAVIALNLNGKFVYGNKASKELSGYREDELLAKPCFDDILIPEDHERVLSYFQQALNGKIVEFETTIIHKTGKKINIHVKGFPVKVKDQIVGAYAIAKDITKQKELEYHNKLAIKLFGQLSHELKTPLNLIFSALQLHNLNLEKMDTAEGRKQKRYAEIIKQNSYRLLKIVNNLVDITKINTDTYNIKFINADIVHIIKQIVLSLEEYIEQQDKLIKFKTNIDKKVISCAPLEIERIMMNLISNAVKFTRPGDKISVSTRDPGDNIEISVKDTGIGIREEDKVVIFGEFKQADDSFNKNREGTGLGLSIVKSLVELHGGEISLKSKYGEGSNFIILLPAKNLVNGAAHKIPDFSGDNIDRIKVEFSDINDN